ncbi:HAD-like domain-containing protein [Mariannaea sp. PMI_226]|nr:HAD-like domain-containing protein [Mariannaea sp. PMI_226]
MRLTSAVGQCRHIARCRSLQQRNAMSISGRIAASPYGLSFGMRKFHNSAAVRSKPTGSLGVNPGNLQEPSDASHKIFSEFGFAFDIDGVLYQGRNRVEGAEKVLKMIRSNGIRYVFLTNGGGVSENKKADTLQTRLQLSKHDDLIRGRMILSHTPMSAWDESIKNEGTVLITGSHPEQARQLALQYGFKRVVTPGDILAACRDVYPFELNKTWLHGDHVPLPDGKRMLKLEDPYTTDIPKDALKIDQIFVWNDPRDWSVDTQIIHDLLISHKGYFGTISRKNGVTSLPNNGWQQDGQPGLWVSNMDLLWKADYPLNRFGTGAFMEALKGLWSTTTDGMNLQFNALGKPSNHTYKYAHDRLLKYYHDMACDRGEAEHDITKCHPLRRVYMIGDNPESDIRGANDFNPDDGTEWISILVRTGVWRQTAMESEPRYKPAVIVDDVVDAVVWALNNEGVKASREWLLSALSHTKGYIKLPELEVEQSRGVSSESEISYPSKAEAAVAKL